jgi:hypothetical protein
MCKNFQVKAIPFVNVMNILAGERARYAAHQTHRFFTANDEFMRILFSGKLPLYESSSPRVIFHKIS